MSDLPTADLTYTVDCPHCHKQFSAQLLRGAAARHHGFKCPHCRLFVPYERAKEPVRAKS